MYNINKKKFYEYQTHQGWRVRTLQAWYLLLACDL